MTSQSSIIFDTVASGLLLPIDGDLPEHLGQSLELDKDLWTSLITYLTPSDFPVKYVYKNHLWAYKVEPTKDGAIIKQYKVEKWDLGALKAIKNKKIIKIEDYKNSKVIHYKILTTITHTLRFKNQRYFWNVIANSTSIKAKDNTRPLVLSQTFKENLLLQFRVPFDMLLNIIPVKSPVLEKKLAQGLYTLQNFQIAAYMKTTNKNEALKLYSAAYGLRNFEKSGMKTFGSRLGITFTDYENATTKIRSGCVLNIQESDEHNLLSLNLYDKVVQSQRSSPDLELEGFSLDHIRVDLTFHKRFYPQIYSISQNKEFVSTKSDAKSIIEALEAIETKMGLETWVIEHVLSKKLCLFDIWAILDTQEDLLNKIEKCLTQKDKNSTVDYLPCLKIWKETNDLSLNDALKQAFNPLTGELVSSRSVLKKAQSIEKDCGISKHLTFSYVVLAQYYINHVDFNIDDYHKANEAILSGKEISYKQPGLEFTNFIKQEHSFIKKNKNNLLSKMECFSPNFFRFLLGKQRNCNDA